MKKISLAVILIVGGVMLAAAQTAPASDREVQARRAEAAVHVDGRLNEAVWQGAGVGDFTQRNPLDGKPASERTEVWVAFDEKALYVAARLYDAEPAKIVRLLGRRDDELESDWFSFAVDPYFDRRSGFQFSVNPAGSIIDKTLYNDEWTDDTWDGVWESAARIDEQGWTVEMRIPYDQLRFPARKEYVWGVNFKRTIQRKNEQDYFSWVPKEENGFVSRFARLTGIRDIRPGRHFEAMPYTVARLTFSPEEAGNPFRTGSNLFASAGLDLKYGLKSNLTLDLSLNPDFGQVEVDPAEVNLSVFETYYSEKRPFFIEGSNIFNFGYGGANNNFGFNWGNPEFFYSRRVGRPPQGWVDSDDSVRYPEMTTILGAAKLSGRVAGNWNIGFLNALTARAYADVDSMGSRSSQEVEPFSDYSVLRVQKEFNQGRQGLGFMGTGVFRDLDDPGLRDILGRQALTLGADGWLQLGKAQEWALTGWLGATRVAGSRDYILDLQQAPLHYFQRPDAEHLALDPEATSLNGWAGRLALNRQKGNWIFNAALGAISPGFEANDLGFQWRGDYVNSHLVAGYNWLHPGKVFRSASIMAALARGWDFGGNAIMNNYFLFLNGEFLNYWGGGLEFGFVDAAYDKEASRGGPLLRLPPGFWVEFDAYSDSRKPLVFSLYGEASRRRDGTREFAIGPALRWKPRSNVSLSVHPQVEFLHTYRQWVTNVDDPLQSATYGRRHVFAYLNEKVLSAEIRLNWIFSPKISLQAFLQPLIAVGKYAEFKELAQPASYLFNYYGRNGSTIFQDSEGYTVDPDGSGPAPEFTFTNPDFNFKSLRGTVVFRWEYRPGSTFYFVWTQNRQDFTNPGDLDFGRDLGDLISAQGDNIFMLKATYRFNL
ncbi:MAG: carbohydrate binding family 9 domain-containing protein [Candidatus Aminicenantes bacterium]|nr:carbohydrate binding family 9 domain-containing protein [Candidatus Aminicenantes bacterium]